MRNIPPCGACHGDIASKLGTPELANQPTTYLRSQLDAFTSGARHNDISMQMRNIARNMTNQEIEASAIYYSRGK